LVATNRQFSTGAFSMRSIISISAGAFFGVEFQAELRLNCLASERRRIRVRGTTGLPGASRPADRHARLSIGQKLHLEIIFAIQSGLVENRAVELTR